MIPSNYAVLESMARGKRINRAREDGEDEVAVLQEVLAAQGVRIASLESDVASLMLAAGFTTQVRPVMPVASPSWPKVTDPPSRIPGFRKAVQAQTMVSTQGSRSYRP